MTDEIRPIIIKKKKIYAADGHHGGAWKVAYADFVTAMMAFFLLMWLLNATTEEQRKGIADYFSPNIPLASISGGGADALNGDTIFSQSKMAQSGTGSNSKKANRNHYEHEDSMDGSNNQGNDDSSATEIEKQLAIMNSELKESAPELAEQIMIHMSPEGLVIELIDKEDSPLFNTGSARHSEVLSALTATLVKSLDQIGNEIKIVGHTDRHSFVGSTQYSNWDLSTDRANSARRLLLESGFPLGQISEVSGKAATQPLTEDPYSPQNRRISITLLTPQQG